MRIDKRLLVVTERFFPETFIVNELVQYFSNKYTKVIVLTQTPSYPRGRVYKGYKNKLVSYSKWGMIQVIRIKTVLGYRKSLFYKVANYFWFMSFGSIVGIFLRKKVDRVFIYQTGPLTMAVPGIVLGKFAKIPVDIWTQDVWPNTVYDYGFKESCTLKVLLDYFVKWVYKEVNQIFVSSTGFISIIEKYSSKKIIYAPSWPLERYDDFSAHLENKNNVFLFAGNVGKVQNLKNLVLGFQDAYKKRRDGLLLIVGDGSAWCEIYDQVSKIDVNIELPGRKVGSSLKSEYMRAKYLIISLSSKGIFLHTLPAKFSMYLSVGKPIICIARGIVAEYVIKNHIGLVADPDSIEDISNTFINAMEINQETYLEMCKNCKRLLDNEFESALVMNRIFMNIQKE